MKLGSAVSTSPKAEGTPKKALGSMGAGAATGVVKTVDVKGGQEKYKGQKSDMNLPQHGGEGTALPKKTDTTLLTNKGGYRGPGANL